MATKKKVTNVAKLGNLEVGKSVNLKAENVNRYNSAIYRANLKYGYKYSRKQTKTGVRITRVA